MVKCSRSRSESSNERVKVIKSDLTSLWNTLELIWLDRKQEDIE